jgi:hypothetical protein
MSAFQEGLAAGKDEESAAPNWPWAVWRLGTTALWLTFAGWVAWLVLTR